VPRAWTVSVAQRRKGGEIVLSAHEKKWSYFSGCCSLHLTSQTTHSTCIFRKPLNLIHLTLLGGGWVGSTCLEDTAVQPSPLCRIGSETPRRRRRAPWETGEPLPLFACPPEGFCGLSTRFVCVFKKERKRRIFDLLALRGDFVRSHGLVRLCQGLLLLYFLHHGVDFGEEPPGWSHPTVSDCSLSSLVVHHSQMVRSHSCSTDQLCARSSVVLREFWHRTVWLLDSFQWMDGSMSLQTFDKISCR